MKTVRDRLALIAAGALAALGCGVVTPSTHEIKGKVLVGGADVKQLAGAHVEATLAKDLSVVASGEIQDDGSFRLETVHAGKPLPGARAGDYRVRIVLSDEDRGAKLRRNRTPVARRFGQFQTSGLKLQAPAAGDVVLLVSAR